VLTLDVAVPNTFDNWRDEDSTQMLTHTESETFEVSAYVLFIYFIDIYRLSLFIVINIIEYPVALLWDVLAYNAYLSPTFFFYVQNCTSQEAIWQLNNVECEGRCKQTLLSACARQTRL
jgi:hypothetical protein